MTDLVSEQLSALLDGELPPEETALLLKRLARDPGLRARLARYSAAGAVLRGAGPAPSVNFAARVSGAIAAERPGTAVQRAAKFGWLQPLAGLGVAAAVAGLAIAVLQHQPTAERAPLQARSVELPSAVVAAVAPARANAEWRGRANGGAVEPSSYVTPAAPTVAAIPRGDLARFVVAHSAVSTPLAGRSMLTSLIAEGTADLPTSEPAAR